MFQHLNYLYSWFAKKQCVFTAFICDATTSTELSGTTPRYVTLTLNWSTWTTMLLDQTGISSSTHVQWQLL